MAASGGARVVVRGGDDRGGGGGRGARCAEWRWWKGSTMLQLVMHTMHGMHDKGAGERLERVAGGGGGR